MEDNKTYLTDTRLFPGQLSQHYESIFASVNPVFIGSEETVFYYGYSSYMLFGRILKILKRLRKSAIDRWRDRTLLQQGQETYYKYIETPSKTRYKTAVLKNLMNLKELPCKRLSYALHALHRYTKIKRAITMQAVLYSIQSKTQNLRQEVFHDIKKLAYMRKVQNRFIKERILWSILCLKNSRKFCIKVSFSTWKKQITSKLRKLKLDINTQITKFKNYERSSLTKVIKAFTDSQSKKKCLSFYKWHETAQSLSKIIEKQKLDNENAKKSKHDKEKLKEFEGNLTEHKEKLLENQIESLLYNFSIDTLNGFLNL